MRIATAVRLFEQKIKIEAIKITKLSITLYEISGSDDVIYMVNIANSTVKKSYSDPE